MITHIAARRGSIDNSSIEKTKTILSKIHEERRITLTINVDATTFERKLFEITYSLVIPSLIYPSNKANNRVDIRERLLEKINRLFPVDLCVLFGYDAHTEQLDAFYSKLEIPIMRFDL